jgi:Tfp pilus assembly protein PilV
MELSSAASSTTEDDGFGLIEVVVSMFMLAVISMSFLPMLITAMKASVTNATVATSNQLINSQLELVRSANTDSRTCASVIALFADSATLFTATDANGKVLSSHRELVVSSSTGSNGCPTSLPGTVSVHVWVTEAGSTTHVADTTTYVYVKS